MVRLSVAERPKVLRFVVSVRHVVGADRVANRQVSAGSILPLLQ